MVNGHSRGQGGLHILRLHGHFFHIGGAGHIDRHEREIQQVTHARHPKSRLLRQEIGAEAVAKAHPHQQHGLTRQHKALAQFINHPAQQRLEEDADDAANHQKLRQKLGGLLKDGHQHPRRKGDKELLARAVQHRQEIVQPVFAVQAQVHPGGLGLFFLHPEHQSRRDDESHRRQRKGHLKGEPQVAEAQKHQKAAQNGSQISQRI